MELLFPMAALADAGPSVIVTRYGVMLARDAHDHVSFLHHELAEELGTPEQVFDHPKSERSRQFLSATSAQH